MKDTENTIISKENIAIKMISHLIKKTQWENKIYIAGGAVRDEILGLQPKDVDLLVLENNGGIEFANWLCKFLNIYKSGSNPLIFEKFGTAKLSLRGITFDNTDLSEIDIECVMPRKEIYKKNSRKPIISAGNLKDDVQRRDFTVNSLLKNISTNEIVDLTGLGVNDIAEGIIRTPLNPDVIFSEDPLRMLRAIRFCVKFNWKLPLSMLRSIKKNAYRLEIISMERVREELNKMLISKHPDKAIRLLQITGLSKYIFPELDLLIDLEQNSYHKYDAMRHTLSVLNLVDAQVENRLAALLHDIGKSATKSEDEKGVHFYQHDVVGAKIASDILKRLRYPKETIQKVVSVVENHMRTKPFGNFAEKASDKSLRKLQNDLGENLDLLLNVVDADNNSHADDFNMSEQVVSLKKRMSKLGIAADNQVRLPINGYDVMTELNFLPGRKIKEVLDFAREVYFENPEISKDAMMCEIKNRFLE